MTITHSLRIRPGLISTSDGYNLIYLHSLGLTAVQVVPLDEWANLELVANLNLFAARITMTIFSIFHINCQSCLISWFTTAIITTIGVVLTNLYVRLLNFEWSLYGEVSCFNSLRIHFISLLTLEIGSLEKDQFSINIFIQFVVTNKF